MKEIMFNFGIVIMFLTYCLLVHSLIKKPDFGGMQNKLRDKLFVLLLCEMLIMIIFRV
jgi:hypothetical protein